MSEPVAPPGIPASALQDRAEFQAAVEKVRADARAGVPEAYNLLATLSAAGVGVPQSWDVALAHLAKGAERGSETAQGQLDALASVRLADWFTPGEKRVLNAAPRVVAIAGFLSPPIRSWLIGLARGRVRPAQVYGADGRPTLESGERSNSGIEFGLLNCDVVLLLVRAKIAANLGVPPSSLENSQILHYAVGQQFRPHIDYLDATLPDVAERGQRIVTFLVYLNDDFEGGETEFLRLGFKHKGGAGDAVYFANIDLATQQPDPRTLHAGLPPTSGEKWLFSQWVRNRAVV